MGAQDNPPSVPQIRPDRRPRASNRLTRYLSLRPDEGEVAPWQERRIRKLQAQRVPLEVRLPVPVFTCHLVRSLPELGLQYRASDR